MLARSTTYTTFGLEALPIDVEVDVSRGLPAFTIVGLPDQAVREARQRVRSAIVNGQYHIPDKRVTVNLAPASLKKEGATFDLAIALGILAASDQLDPARLASIVAVGELALDGGIRLIQGMLVIAMAMRPSRTPLLVPVANAAEAGLVDGLNIVPVATLNEAVEALAGLPTVPRRRAPRRRAFRMAANQYDVDFAEVKGQVYAKRALEVSAAGSHHLLLIGPPGSGKTMLAQRLPTIQSDLCLDDALEITKIHSLAGSLEQKPLVTRRPFRAPHHTSSDVALIGGGPAPKPGEISLAQHGVLFLDELPEFHRNVLESLREPLEAGFVRVARAKRSVTFPARFLLVAAMNPCPCGYFTDPRGRCRCPSTAIARYLGKISGPLLDRIDLHVDVPAVPFDILTQTPNGETSAQVRSRVLKAQAWRRQRGQQHSNAQLRSKELKAYCQLTTEATHLLKSAMQELSLSARSYTKILKIARTIADLAAQEMIQADHVAEAVQYRSLDRQLWI